MEGEFFAGDLYVDDSGMFQSVDSAPSGAETIDADGLVALPGLVDLHRSHRDLCPFEMVKFGAVAAKRLQLEIEAGDVAVDPTRIFC